MARTDVTPETAVDTTSSFQSIGGIHETNARRDVSLVIRPAGDVFDLTVQTNDPELQAALGATSTYALPLTREDLWSAVQKCRGKWKGAVDRYLNDVSAPEPQVPLLRDLAEAGYKLFQKVFFPEDPDHNELRRVCTALAGYLDRGERRVRVESSRFFAPWNLMYSKEVPLEPGPDLDPSGFWGYQHLIEHVPSDAGNQRFEPSGRHDPYRISLQVDTNLDTEFAVPVVAPLAAFLGGYSESELRQICRYAKNVLGRALRSGPHDDHFMYFCCHAQVDGFDSTINIAPSWLNLSDRPENHIEPDDITYWLREQMLASHPVVFLNACGGAQMNSTFYEGFAKVFLSREASAVIGPQTEVPALFAGEFAKQFLEEFFLGGEENALGRVLHRLSRKMWDDYHNPLGLVYSLYRGADLFLTAPIRSQPPAMPWL
jgi:hypothetical protein